MNLPILSLFHDLPSMNLSRYGLWLLMQGAISLQASHHGLTKPRNAMNSIRVCQRGGGV